MGSVFVISSSGKTHMLVVLELQDQPANIRRVTVRHDIVVGRGSDCNLRLSAPQISRRHCFLRIGRDSVSIMDLDSRNGTFLDNVRVESGRSYNLTHGAVLALGPIRFRVEIRSETGTDSDQPVLDESIAGLDPRTHPNASTHAADPGLNAASLFRGDTAPRSTGKQGLDPAGLNESTAGMDEDAGFSPGSGETSSHSEQSGRGPDARGISKVCSECSAAPPEAPPTPDPAAEFARAAERLAGEKLPQESGADWFSGISPSPLQQVDDDLRQFFRSLS